jgi:hypothetical protein
MEIECMEINRSAGPFYGAFGRYVVYGTLFKDQGGERIWLLNLTRGWADDHEGSNHDYWVSDDEFREAGGRNLEALTPRSTYFRGPTVTGLDPAEKQAALEAIGEWEGRGARDLQQGGRL